VTVYGVGGWCWFTEVERLGDWLDSYGVSFVDRVFVDSTGFGWGVGEMVEELGRVLIPTTAEHHAQYLPGDELVSGELWTWDMTHDALWEWECREGCTTDYVYEVLELWGALTRVEMEALVRCAMRYIANQDECLLALELELGRYDMR